MIKVLQDWQEVGEVAMALQREGLLTHHTVQKNWDHFLLREALSEISKDAKILDLGCGEGYTLKFLQSLGFRNLHGIDLSFGWKLHVTRLQKMKQGGTLKVPFRLHKGDITKTVFPDNSFDVAASVSVIEHGVNVEAFFTEAFRILKPGGLLFLTTDYWEEKLATDDTIRAFGMPWRIFSRAEIAEKIEFAQSIGFKLCGETNIPACAEKTVCWQGKDYTFVALTFRKSVAR